MTLDELVEAFRSKAWPIPTRYGGEGSDKEGIRAVVEALRREMGFWWTGCDCCDRNSDVLDEILASDGVEAAGGSARKGERAGHHHGLSTPAAAPVCEWTLDEAGDWADHAHGCSAIHTPRQTMCVMCGNPIKFTEAAR